VKRFTAAQLDDIEQQLDRAIQDFRQLKAKL
jgi:hypothetical protein